jgi:hypothetical protein
MGDSSMTIRNRLAHLEASIAALVTEPLTNRQRAARLAVLFLRVRRRLGIALSEADATLQRTADGDLDEAEAFEIVQHCWEMRQAQLRQEGAAS